MRRGHVLTTAGALLALAVARPADCQKRAVDLTAPDGITLKASFFPAGRPGPGVILLHMCGGATRTSWDGLASRLATAGFHTLTIDYRGFGESGGARYDGLDDRGRRAAQAQWPEDFEAAYAYLVAQPGVDRERIAAGGASCGVDNCIQLAIRHREVKALVLLSGGTRRSGIDFLAASPGVPLFLAGSRDDNDFSSYMRWLSRFSSNPRNTLVEYEKAGHGTDMFKVEKDLEPAIVAWLTGAFRDTAASAGAAPAPAPTPDPQREFWSVLSRPDGTAPARELLREVKARDPGAVLIPELAVRVLAGEYLIDGKPADALRVLEVGAEAFPSSAYVAFTLGRTLAEVGDTAKAIATMERTLRLIDASTTMTDQQKQDLRTRAQQRLTQYRAP